MDDAVSRHQRPHARPNGAVDDHRGGSCLATETSPPPSPPDVAHGRTLRETTDSFASVLCTCPQGTSLRFGQSGGPAEDGALAEAPLDYGPAEQAQNRTYTAVNRRGDAERVNADGLLADLRRRHWAGHPLGGRTAEAPPAMWKPMGGLADVGQRAPASQSPRRGWEHHGNSRRGTGWDDGNQQVPTLAGRPADLREQDWQGWHGRRAERGGMDVNRLENPLGPETSGGMCS
jgi:hypothetical protein